MWNVPLLGAPLSLLANLLCFNRAFFSITMATMQSAVHAFILDSGSPSMVYFRLWASERLGGSGGMGLELGDTPVPVVA